MTVAEPHLVGASVPEPKLPRFAQLDGWRGISILSVIAAHWLPLGPSSWLLNDAAGLFGMAIFFSLSGFLITSTLVVHPSVRPFLVRRLARVVPAAWLYIGVVAIVVGLAAGEAVAALLFVANVPPYWLGSATGHLWSLGVEMHFYLAIALLFAALRRRALALVPLLCLAATGARIVFHHPVSIFTPFRVDEILVGGWLAVCVFREQLADLPFARLRIDLARLRVPIVVAAILLLLASHTSLEALNYVRPYAAGMLVGLTLSPRRPSRLDEVLCSRRLAYVASISYSLYLFHPLFSYGWLDQGSDPVRYAKRVPAAFATWGVAHLSTVYYERWWIERGRRLGRRLDASRHHGSAPNA